MRKQFALVLMTVAVMASCNESGNPNNFRVSGKIQHAPSQNIFLEQVSYDNTPPKIVDSGKIDQTGSYKLKAVAKEQSLYLITLDHKPVFILVNDNNDIRISSDLNRDFRTPYITNSDGTKSLYELLNNFRSKDSMLAVTYGEIDSLSKLNPNTETY
ncbi:MAG: DUF4369 domain-containing protein, partial [Panacibacter sp.]